MRTWPEKCLSVAKKSHSRIIASCESIKHQLILTKVGDFSEKKKHRHFTRPFQSVRLKPGERGWGTRLLNRNVGRTNWAFRHISIAATMACTIYDSTAMLNLHQFSFKCTAYLLHLLCLSDRSTILN